MKKSFYLLCLLTLISFSTLLGQADYTISGKSIYDIRTQTFPMWSLPVYTFNKRVVIPSKINLTAVKPDWTGHYFAHLGFFCKVELKLEHQTRFPVKFRLGTVEYVDQLERKR